MFSTQQLLKALRKLQANGISGSDLVKSLQYAAIAGNNNSQQSPLPTTHVDTPLWVTSLLSAQGMTSSITPTSSSSTAAAAEEAAATATVVSPKKQQQQTSGASSHEHEITENENSSEASHCQQSNNSIESNTNNSNSNSNSHKLSVAEQHVVSLYSNLNEIGSLTYTESTCTTTQDSSKKINTPKTTTPQHFCNINRNQSIQNFYQQQQLQQFHIQHNQSLYAKQKQTQFAMSSLAAEPLSLKSPQDDISTNHNGDAAKLNGEEKENDSTSTLKSSPSSPGAPASGKPCFNTGFAEILQFMELIGNLKHTKRTGWVLRDVNDCESISGHMYRMSMMTFLLDGTEGLNQIRCMELALVHDLAESLVGDITPFCGISKDDKRAMEFKAMEDICKLIEPRGKRIMELFEEYEHGQSAESKFVKDLDRLDMVMQAFEYEKRDNCLLKHQEFFDSTEGKFQHPFVQKLVEEIYVQRKDLAKAKGAIAPPTIKVPNMEEIARKLNGHCAVRQHQQEQTTSTSTS